MHILVTNDDGVNAPGLLALALEMRKLGEVTVLAQTTQPALGEWHWFTIAMQGAHIQVYVDRVLALDYTDPNPLTAGTAGLGDSIPAG